jgi:hypothetical protein
MKRKEKSSEVAPILVVVIGLLLSSCSDDEPDRAAASADSPVAEASETDDTGATAPPHLEGDASLLSPGAYEFSVSAWRGRRDPGAVVDVPNGFVDGDDWYVVSEDQDAFLGLWDTRTVWRDACVRPHHDALAPGPGVADLADALVAQRSTRATPPEPVTFAGREALYLELTGPRDLGRCGPKRGLADTRGIYTDGQVDLLWIVDVDGQRLVVDASYGPTATAEERDAVTAMAESLRFEAAGE